MADQLAPHFTGAYGHPVVQTPALDALAGRGVRFDAAYCNFPLCAPSRFSMLSGQMPASIGAWDNGAEFAASVPTLVHYLRLLGYRTTLSGKMHFIGPDQLHGFEERLTTDIYPSGVCADARLGGGIGAAERLVHHGQPVRSGPGGDQLPARLRRGDRVRRGAAPARPGPGNRRRAAVLPGGVVHPSPRSLRGPPAVVGPVRPRRHRPARPDRSRRGRSSHPAAVAWHRGRRRRRRPPSSAAAPATATTPTPATSTRGSGAWWRCSTRPAAPTTRS